MQSTQRRCSAVRGCRVSNSWTRGQGCCRAGWHSHPSVPMGSTSSICCFAFLSTSQALERSFKGGWRGAVGFPSV